MSYTQGKFQPKNSDLEFEFGRAKDGRNDKKTVHKPMNYMRVPHKSLKDQ